MKAIRISDTTFAPLGSQMPHPSATTRGEVMENIAHTGKELLRWSNGIAWVYDDIPPDGLFSTRPPVLTGMAFLVTDGNAAAVNAELFKHLSVYQKWSCCIIRDLKTVWTLKSDVAFSEARVSDSLLPLAKDNIEALGVLKRVSLSAKTIFDLISRKSDPDIPLPNSYWTRKDIEEGEKEDELIRNRIEALELGG